MGVAAIASLLIAGSGTAKPAGGSPCHLAPVSAERVVLRPKAGTFYSVDVLNPDVIAWHNRYWLLFSGNSAASDAGVWRTGVAVARGPLGPFRVLPGSAGFLNGSTRSIGRTLVQVATPLDFGPPTVYRSRDLRSWRRITSMPAPTDPIWNHWQSDPYYDDSGRVYFAARPGPSGADIGSRRYFGRTRWGKARPELKRGDAGGWANLDLGEPATFLAGRRHFMLFTGLGAQGGPRQIGLAYKDGTWHRCYEHPLIRSGRSRWTNKNAIDPEPLIAGHTLYVYYAGGQTASLGGNMHGTIVVRAYALRAS